jgi:hypothetical protein
MPVARGAVSSNVSQSSALQGADAGCSRQWEVLAGALDAVPAGALTRRIRTGGWTVADFAERARQRASEAAAAVEPHPARCVEGVVHLLDLAAAVPELGMTPEPLALKASVRSLLAMLAERAPGRAVEVRVPPYAAVQCVAGPRHTRGTPPNVVEADPITWVELATGRLAWSSAVSDGRLRASGERADIGALLPLLAVHW